MLGVAHDAIRKKEFLLFLTRVFEKELKPLAMDLSCGKFFTDALAFLNRLRA